MNWLKRIGVAVVMVLITCALTWSLFSRPISEALYRAAVSSRTLPDASEQPGLQVYLCGTGSPLPDPSRSGPCLGILASGQAFVIDPGEGAARRLSNMGFPTGAIEAVILTHLHSDHMDGLGGILLQAWVGGGRKHPTKVYGPAGVEQVIAGVNETFRVDSTFRTAHHGNAVADPAGYGAIAQVVTLGETGHAQIIDNESVSITATSVSHAPVHPAMGLRIEHAGRSVSFSGDTLYDARFVELSNEVDLMLHDAMQHWMVEAMEDRLREILPHGTAATIFHDIVDYHASPEDAAKAARDANAKALVLTHVAPPIPSQIMYPAFLGDAPKIFDGPITVGEDGMIFSFKPVN